MTYALDAVGTDEVAGRLAVHGGDLAAARAAFPGAPEPWLDLSTGISPISYPLSALPATAFTRLPEPARLDALGQAASLAYGAPSREFVVAAPGTQMLIPLLAGSVAPGRALVLGPTYAEHARAAGRVGHDVATTGDFEALEAADYAVVVNPNNPDGRLIARDALLRLRARMRPGSLLVVDEAFMEAAPRDESLCADAGGAGLAVLRSFGKFHGLAGVRLGFAVTHPALAARLEASLGPWAVSGPALEYGIAALDDPAWRHAHRDALAGLAARLNAALSQAGLEIVGGTSLFRLARHRQAGSLFCALGGAGILVRPFASRPEVVRFGLPGDDAAFERLARALSTWRRQGMEG